MNKNGFHIEKLSLLGINKKTATVSFSIGLNVIYGASDTGKTYIYQCVNYMLGRNKTPKKIPESTGYTTCKLEIKSYKGDKFTLERRLNGGNFKLIGENSTTEEVLFTDNKKYKSERTISDFLLGICNMTGKKVRKNAKGETQDLYFQGLMKYFSVSETNIITDESPIITKQYVNKTRDDSIFRFILTGSDDSEIIVLLKKDEITNKKGKIELYGELISNLQDEMKSFDFSEINDQVKKIDYQINNFRTEYLLSNKDLKKYNEEKNIIYKDILSLESKVVNVEEILKRSKILKEQYKSDISRLKATLEANHAFNTITISNCPVCNSSIHNVKGLNNQDLLLSINNEILKIDLLLKEQKESYAIFVNEKNIFLRELKDKKKHHNDILLKIKKEVNEKVREIAERIHKISKKKEELSRILTLKIKLDEFIIKRNHIAEILERNKKSDKNTNYEKLTHALLSPILNNIEEILLSMEFDTAASVLYSEESQDFIIGEKNRQDFGKGYRAILFAIYIISVAEHLKSMPFQIGMVIIDSPLNPYKPDEVKDNGVVAENLANNFYKYLAFHTTDNQVILIENTEVPKELVEKVNLVSFTKSNGFIPL